MENEAELRNLVRVGIVSELDRDKCKARVRYDNLGMHSGWLFVLQHYAANISVTPDNSHTHEIFDTYSNGGSASTIENHDHPGTHIATWMPKVGERVLVLYIPIFNGDGFILGGLR